MPGSVVYMSRQLIGKGLDEVITMVDVQGMLARRDGGLHIGIDKVLGHDELFPKNVQDLIAADEAYEQDPAIRDDGDRRDLRVGPQHQGGEVMLLDELVGGLALEAAVPVVPVVKALKVFGLPLQCRVAREKLPPEELPVIGVVEVFHDPVAPRLACGDEDRGDAVVEAHAQDDPQGSGMAVASPEAQFVIKLQECRDTHALPAPHEALSHVEVLLCSLGFDIDPVAEHVHDVERIESAVVLDIPGTDEIHLMEVVDSPRVRKIGILDTFRDVGSFF
jgi:hypothetical protein